jgi:hypothetical protein
MPIRNAVCLIMAAAITLAATFLVGVACLITSLQWSGEGRDGLSIAITVAFLVLLCGVGEAVREIYRKLLYVLSGRGFGQDQSKQG